MQPVRSVNQSVGVSECQPYDWEPAKTLGSFILSMGAVPFTFAICARKLELDLRRTQLPRKEVGLALFTTFYFAAKAKAKAKTKTKTP
jgi:hypothetical protein